MNRTSVVIITSIALVLLAVLLVFQIVAHTNSAKKPGILGIKAGDDAILLDKAEKSYEQGYLDAAMGGAESVISRYTDSPNLDSAYYLLGMIYEQKKDLVKAKEAYQTVVDRYPGSPRINKVKESLDDINVAVLFSPIVTPDSMSYEIQKGDTLGGIAGEFGTTVELISKANKLKNANIRFGKKLKITKLRFSIVVDKTQNILTLKADGNIFKTYRVSTGKNAVTPTGSFKIITKIVNPPWYPQGGGVIPAGDPRNVLGSRWLGLSSPSYGIHGTVDPGSIGQSVTEGCVRMKNTDVEELFTIVPEGTEVVIVD